MYGRLSQIEFHETAISRNETYCCLEFIVNITRIINFLSKKKEYLKTKYFEFLINVIIIYSNEYFTITFLKFKNIKFVQEISYYLNCGKQYGTSSKN